MRLQHNQCICKQRIN
ncbi:hypothetical protein LINPERPRIM_LOCUS11505 [Linum perenne]